MSLTENSNQVFLPGGATNSQNSPYISDWPLDQTLCWIPGERSSPIGLLVYLIFFIFVGNQDMHKSLDGFNFGQRPALTNELPLSV